MKYSYLVEYDFDAWRRREEEYERQEREAVEKARQRRAVKWLRKELAECAELVRALRRRRAAIDVADTMDSVIALRLPAWVVAAPRGDCIDVPELKAFGVLHWDDVMWWDERESLECRSV